MSYDLSIQPKDPKSVTQKAQAEAFIASLPGVRQESAGVFAYGDTKGRLFVHIYTGESETIDSIGFSVPAAYSKSSFEPALLLSFKIANHLGWDVFDEQLGDYLHESTASEVLRSQKELGDTDEEVLSRRAAGEATFTETFGHHLTHYRRAGMLSSIILAAVIAGFIVVYFRLSENCMFWIGFGVWLVIVALRAFALTVWERK